MEYKPFTISKNIEKIQKVKDTGVKIQEGSTKRQQMVYRNQISLQKHTTAEFRNLKTSKYMEQHRQKQGQNFLLERTKNSSAQNSMDQQTNDKKRDSQNKKDKIKREYQNDSKIASKESIQTKRRLSQDSIKEDSPKGQKNSQKANQVRSIMRVLKQCPKLAKCKQYLHSLVQKLKQNPSLKPEIVMKLEEKLPQTIEQYNQQMKKNIDQPKIKQLKSKLSAMNMASKTFTWWARTNYSFTLRSFSQNENKKRMKTLLQKLINLIKKSIFSVEQTFQYIPKILEIIYDSKCSQDLKMKQPKDQILSILKQIQNRLFKSQNCQFKENPIQYMSHERQFCCL